MNTHARHKGLCIASVAFLLFLAEMFFPRAGFAQPPLNDECSGAAVILSIPYSTSQNTRLATANPNDPEIFCNEGTGLGKTVWFKYVADATRNVYFSTRGSSPSDYDVMLGVFAGSCGGLVLVACNDDIETGVIRQSEISVQLTAGTAYYVLIGEWNNGGPNGGVPTGGDLVLNVYAGPPPPVVKGPKAGFVNGGVTVTTDSYGVQELAFEAGRGLKSFEINKTVKPLPTPPNVVTPLGPEGSNYVEDVPAMISRTPSGIARPVVLKSFEGIPQTYYIPPDPIVAAGPNHVITAVNSTFRIFDKSGTILKTINSNAWFATALPGASLSDPIVMYDHFAERWIFTSIQVDDNNKTAHIMLSVSDDDNPLGIWYNWALPANVLGDSTVTNWTDYDRVGFDSLAIYITGNQFDFGTFGFKYTKLRVIDKSKLYANTAGPVGWNDFWDFREPSNYGVVFGLRPTIMFGNPGVSFLLNESPFAIKTFFTVWTVKNPLSNPMCSGVDVPVVQYSSPPDPQQLGGGSMLIEAAGSDIHNEPVYCDGSLWAVHSVASGPNKAYSAVRYVRIDPFNGKTIEDVAMGLTGYWHIYPAIMPDKDKNLIITFCRSNAFEYMGAFATGRRAGDALGLAPSITIQEGLANYVKDYGTGRNRWGDYNGIALDRQDGNAVWTHTEYVSAKDTWGTWVGKLKMGPVPGVFMNLDRTSVAFGRTEVGGTSDTVSVAVRNDGLDSLAITSISPLGAHFKLLGLPSTPRKIESLGTLILGLVFTPKAPGEFVDSIVLLSDDPNHRRASVLLRGTGYSFVTAQSGTMYATSSAADGGRIFTVNTSTGGASPLGPTSAGQITSLRVNPLTKDLIGIDPTASAGGAAVYRVSGAGFIVQQVSTIPFLNLKGMAFKNDSIMYIGSLAGTIYEVDYRTGVTTKIADTGLNIAGLALNPISGELWASVRPLVAQRDAIYKINLTTGSPTQVGNTGFNAQTLDIVFDKNGKLYGVIGLGANENNLITIDTLTAAGTLAGPMGISAMQAIALSPDAVAGAEGLSLSLLPTVFSLEQNFPNPFNPRTTIQYSLPQPSRVNLRIYDALGREVIVLVSGYQRAGTYRVTFDGGKFASGLYYCKLAAGSFEDVKRMMLVK